MKSCRTIKIKDILSTCYKYVLPAIIIKLNVPGTYVICTIFLVSVFGNRAQNLSASLTYLLPIYPKYVCTFELYILSLEVMQFVTNVTTICRRLTCFKNIYCIVSHERVFCFSGSCGSCEYDSISMTLNEA
jgi:hypothetical protein